MQHYFFVNSHGSKTKYFVNLWLKNVVNQQICLMVRFVIVEFFKISVKFLSEMY